MIYFMLIYYMILMLLIMILLFMFFLMSKMILFIELELIKICSMKLEILFFFDWISLLFMSVVLMISIMVIIYSMEYMESDLNLNRFMLLVIMFILSMMMMILSPNMMSILIGWDGLGLVSYCLVIYYQSGVSYNSGMVTVLTNRIGDILILMMIGLMIFLGSWNFMFFYYLSDFMLFLLLMSAITKSAQIPFSSWLPMAMAAPTPVSSLVHSSTLVTAGVYLIIRFNYLLMNSFNLMKFLMLLSILTMFISGMGANFEYDLKKIIALSTLSQLGVMIFCLSLGFMEVSFFHLLSHAMFKSMLFMCSGIIIHNMMYNQDIRYISMILYNMPLVSLFFNCSIFSLCGIPFMSGFFSKDLILEIYLMGNINKMMMFMLFFSMGLTIMYSMRLLYYSFIKMPQLIYFNNYKSLSNKMVLSMNLLFLMSIMVGMILSWMLFSMKNMIYLSLMMKLMIYIYMILGMVLGVILPKLFMNYFFFFYINLYYNFFLMMWFMSMIYGINIKNILNFSKKMLFNLEFTWNEMIMGMNIILYLKMLFKLDFLIKNFFLLLIYMSYMILFVMII